MPEALPITTNISARFVERKWMRAAKAWRCFVDIPSEGNIPEVLTALIERQVHAKLTDGDISVDINPAWIVDVPSKKRQFQVVIETVYEQQASIGPRLTALTDTPVTLSILPLNTQPSGVQSHEQPHNVIDTKTLRGLHISFFQNPKFWEWVSAQTSETIGNPEDCKRAFKAALQVTSCKDMTRSQLSATVKAFNAWLNGGDSAQAS